MFTEQVLKATETVCRTGVIQPKELFLRWTPRRVSLHLFVGRSIVSLIPDVPGAFGGPTTSWFNFVQGGSSTVSPQIVPVL